MMEVCVDNIQSVINASVGGASRLELCSALSEGGLTPTVGFLIETKKISKLPVFVMIRQRIGDDFQYNQNEIEVMKTDMKLLKENGADGFVFGALTIDYQVDEKICKEFLKIADPLPVTFHRAFDFSKNPFEALETIIKLGFKRLLTSGQAETAEEGRSLIKELISAARDRIIIMPGAGINILNLRQILSETNAIEFHGSAKKINSALLTTNCNDLLSNNKNFQVVHHITDSDTVRCMINIAEKYYNDNKN